MRDVVLDRRALNRATLERQLLLQRSEIPVLDAVAHLVGLQAQVPSNPYTALWSRLARFRPEELSALLEDRRVVRTALMRATIHLVSADDCLRLRPLVQPVLDADLARHPEYGPLLAGVDLEPMLGFARRLLADHPCTGTELRAALADAFPGHDSGAFAVACRNRLTLVQVPPRGLWGRSGQVRSTTAESWLGRRMDARPSIEDMVLRYVAAFGPASTADVAAWCRLTGLREVIERLRPKLVVFRDERGRELFDLPEAPRPDPALPAPPRFLPEYDNTLLAHADRSRFVSDEDRALLGRASGPGYGAALHDGFVRGLWRVDVDRGTGEATLTVKHLRPVTKRGLASLEAEGRWLLRFLAADASGHDVRLAGIE